MNYNPADYFVQTLAIVPGEEEQCRDRVKVRSVLYVLTIRTTVNCSYSAISRKVVGKTVHATIPKGNMGYDQYTFPDTVAVEPTFIAFL